MAAGGRSPGASVRPGWRMAQSSSAWTETVVRRSNVAQAVEVFRAQGAVPDEIALLRRQRHDRVPRLVV